MEIALGPAVIRVGADVDAAALRRVLEVVRSLSVILVPPGVRILLAAQPVDFRKGMDGLAALVQQALRADPFAGDVFIFRPKRADRVKILVYDGTGLCLYAKRLEAGRFSWPSPAEGVVRLTSASSRPCSRACRGTGSSPARSLARARLGERKCWLLGLVANRIAPCRWRWMIFHEIPISCCSICSR